MALSYMGSTPDFQSGRCGFESRQGHSCGSIVSMGSRTWTDDQLRQAVSRSKSLSHVISALGMSPRSAQNHARMRGHVERLGLSTEHFEIVRGTRTRKSLDEILVEGRHTDSGSLRKRLIRAGYKKSECEGCGLSEWRGEPIALELDHVNGVHDDNRLSNLRILCPNCHSLTPTWRGRNTKKTRDSARTICACGKKKVRQATVCADCHSTSQQTKIVWPPRDTVLELVKDKGFSGAGRVLGVSDNAIRKYLTPRR